MDVKFALLSLKFDHYIEEYKMDFHQTYNSSAAFTHLARFSLSEGPILSPLIFEINAQGRPSPQNWNTDPVWSEV